MTFDEFVALRLGALLRYATVVTCDPHLAEDITQEVLLRAQARWAGIVRMDQPEAYVKRMVLNEFLSWRRRRAARTVPMSAEGLDAAAGPQSDPTAAVDERDDLVRRIASLPPKQRAVVALRYFDNRTDEEIADLLDCAVGTVRSHASRALASLRGAITGPGSAPPAPRLAAGEVT
jgi:RNA polymerase sigma-70 factor (sigma-E family)